VSKTSGNIYGEILKSGLTVLWDERPQSPGIKFKDIDLIGIPYRLIVSKRTIKDGEVEFKKRIDKMPVRWKIREVSEKLKELKIGN
jgi:prolyl-tRNA synthetase